MEPDWHLKWLNVISSDVNSLNLKRWHVTYNGRSLQVLSPMRLSEMTSEWVMFNHLQCHFSSTALGTRTGYWEPTQRGTDEIPLYQIKLHFQKIFIWKPTLLKSQAQFFWQTFKEFYFAQKWIELYWSNKSWIELYVSNQPFPFQFHFVVTLMICKDFFGQRVFLLYCDGVIYPAEKLNIIFCNVS